MKVLLRAISGVILTLSGFFLYTQYYTKYIVPKQLVYFYVACLAKHQNKIDSGELKTKQTPLEICHLSNDQVQEILK